MYRTYIALAFLLAVAVVVAAGLVVNYYQRRRKRRPVTVIDYAVKEVPTSMLHVQQFGRALRQQGLTPTGRTPSQPAHQPMPPRQAADAPLHYRGTVVGSMHMPAGPTNLPRRPGLAVAPVACQDTPAPQDSGDALALAMAGFQLAESLFDSSPVAPSFTSGPSFDGGGDFGGGGSTGDF